MQALALWDIGLKRWNEKRAGRKTPEKRPGVTVNRRDLVSIPVPDANLLWRNLRVRDVRTVDGRPRTSNIRIDIVVEGVTETGRGPAAWSSTTPTRSRSTAGRCGLAAGRRSA